MKRRLARRLIVTTALVTGLIAGTSLSSAYAWPWSSTVKVTGRACGNVGGRQTWKVTGTLDGRSFADSGKGLTDDYRYTVVFTNVRPGKVAEGGGGRALMQSVCSRSGTTKAWQMVERPTLGDTISGPNFG